VGARSRETRVFMAALVLAFAGGAAALAHQLLWTRRLIDLLGASHEAAARVFGVFFLGLALGSMVAALVLARLRRPWRFLGWMELGIGALALPVAVLPWWTGWIWPALGPDALVGAAGGWVRLMVSVVCLLPPSFCMGFFVPVVARELARGPGGAGGGRALALYAANTLGGVAGLAVAAGFAIHALGLFGAMLAAAGVNLLVAAGCFALGRGEVRATGSRKESDENESGPECGIGARGCRALAFVSGMAVLATEVLLVTLLGLVVPVSFYGPAAMLGLVILALALAAALVALPQVRRFNPERLLAVVLVAAALLLVVSPWAFHALAAGVPALVKAGSAVAFVAKLAVLVGLSFGLAMVAAGMVFPLALLLAARARCGCGARAWGWLLAWNGIGALAGAELAYRVLLPAAGLHAAFGWVACGYAAVAVAVAMRTGGTARAGIALASVAACFFLAIPRLDRLPVVNPHVGFTSRETLAGREGVVAVVEHPALGRGILLSNQYLLGSTSARWSQERQAHLPLLLHPAPKRVAFLGVATGNTPAAALSHTAVESVDAVEISPLVIEAARRHFADLNRPLFSDPRARVVVEDGRTWFAACRGRYDVIAGDLFQPWGPGEGRLFSIEHFTAVRHALADGGLFCQWLPGHQLTREEYETILATFCEVFGAVEVFADGFFSRTPSIALIGWKDGALDWSEVQRNCDRERRAGSLLDPVVRHAEGLQLLQVATIKRGRIAAGINTLDNNRIELAAGRRQIEGRGSQGTLKEHAWLAWLHQVGGQNRLAARLHDAELRAVQQRKPLARSPEGEELWLEMPSTLRSDRHADWGRWPGTLRPRF
jgi:spermidine synthase